MKLRKLGIIGGTGWLGGVLARGILSSAVVAPDDMWISNRSGATGGFEAWPGVRFTTDNRALVGACEAVLLAVMPGQLSSLGIDADGKLVLSVMAGTTAARIAETTGATRIVRSMPTFTAQQGLSYTPWFATPDVSPEEKSWVQDVLATSGLAEEVAKEDLIDVFTALTGSGPGFVAYMAQCMIRSAVLHGVEPAQAERAVRQLFRGAGAHLAESETSPGELVQVLLDYGGTTAAGLRVLEGSSLAEDLHRAIATAHAKARGDLTG